MGSWTPLHRSNRTSVKLKGFVKPGRWYQFRVAAVNRIGSRGWSAPSKQFITSLGPRPPAAPPNVKIGGMVRANETVKAKLSWDAPASDLPVHRYRVFWSRRLHGASPLDSVLVQQRTLPKVSCPRSGVRCGLDKYRFRTRQVFVSRTCDRIRCTSFRSKLWRSSGRIA